jgi:Ca2+/Na+ antiporter
MENIIFQITLIIVFIANSIQCFKIIKNKSSIGISVDAYYLTFISVLIMFISSNDFNIKIICFVELIFTILTLFFIFKYKESKFKYFNFNKSFYIPLFFSFFMIFGIAQSISSFKNKTNKSSVSIAAYLLWFLLNVFLIYLSNDIYVIAPLIITNILYIYIIFDYYLKKYSNI